LSKANLRDTADDDDDDDEVGPSSYTGPAIVVHCEASSEAGAGYGCRSAFDGKDDTAWATNGEGVHSWIMATFEGSWDITAMTILQNGGDELNKRLRLTFSDGSSQVKDLTNAPEAQTVQLTPVRTSSVRIEVLDVYGTLNNGARTIAFTGTAAEPVLPPSTASAPGSAVMDLFGDATSALMVAAALVDSHGVPMQGLDIFAARYGYIGVYHAYLASSQEYEVRLAKSFTLTAPWMYVRTLAQNAKSPKIFVCGEHNDKILVAYEQWMTAKSRAPSRIAFELFDDEEALTAGSPRVTYVAPLTAGFMSQLEGDPTIYAASVTTKRKKTVLAASVGFRYQETYRNMHQLASGSLELTITGSSITSSSFSGRRAAAYQAFFEMRGADGNSGSGTCGELLGKRYCLQEASHRQPRLSSVFETPAVYLYAFAGREDAAPEGIGAGGLVTVDASNVAAQNDLLAGLGHPSWSVVPCPNGIAHDDCLFVSYYDRTAGADAQQIAFVKPL